MTIDRYIIYKISFLNNPKVYIGQTNSLRRRYNEYKCHLNNSSKKNWKIHNALRKYGIENAIFEVIATCLINNKDCANQAEIALIEQYDSFENGYNMTVGGGGHSGLKGENHPLWGKKHSEEAKNKMRLSHRDISGHNHHNYGKFGADNPKSKIWKIFRTDNRVDITTNRRQWAKDNGYSDGNISNFYVGRKNKYRDIIKVETL